MSGQIDRPFSVLLIDGDHSSRRVLNSSLEHAGFEVTAVETADAARKRLLSGPPDLILSDTFSARGDGYALCNWVKTTPLLERTPFIFVTSNTSDEARRQATAAACDDYLVKPLFFHDVVSRLRTAIERRQQAQSSQREALTGPLSQFSVVDLIQLTELRQRTGVVKILAASGEGGKLYFRAGQLVDAELGESSGEQAVMRILPWREGTFQLSWEDVEREALIHRPNSALILDWIAGNETEPDAAAPADGVEWDGWPQGVEEDRPAEQDPVDEALAERTGIIETASHYSGPEVVIERSKVEVVAGSSGDLDDTDVAGTARAPAVSSEVGAAGEVPVGRARRRSRMWLVFALMLVCGLGEVLAILIQSGRSPSAPPAEPAGSVSLPSIIPSRAEEPTVASVPPVLAQLGAAGEPDEDITQALLPRETEQRGGASDRADPDQEGSDLGSAIELRVRAQLLASVEGPELEQLVQRHATRWRIFEQLALEELSWSRFERALRIARSVLQVHARAARAHLIIGAVLHHRGRVRGAKRAYERYLELCPECAFTREVRSILRRL